MSCDRVDREGGLDLAEQLSMGCLEHEKRWSGDTHYDLGGSIREEETDQLMDRGAKAIYSLLAERDALLASQGYTYIGKDGKPILARDLEDQRDALKARNQKLRDAAQAVVDRWDTPLWKYAEATGCVINQLRGVLAEQEKPYD